MKHIVSYMGAHGKPVIRRFATATEAKSFQSRRGKRAKPVYREAKTAASALEYMREKSGATALARKRKQDRISTRRGEPGLSGRSLIVPALVIAVMVLALRG